MPTPCAVCASSPGPCLAGLRVVDRLLVEREPDREPGGRVDDARVFDGPAFVDARVLDEEPLGRERVSVRAAMIKTVPREHHASQQSQRDTPPRPSW